MLQNVTFCYVFAFFSVDRLIRDPVAGVGRSGDGGAFCWLWGKGFGMPALARWGTATRQLGQQSSAVVGAGDYLSYGLRIFPF
jgi:hypothetical protein